MEIRNFTLIYDFFFTEKEGFKLPETSYVMSWNS